MNSAKDSRKVSGHVSAWVDLREQVSTLPLGGPVVPIVWFSDFEGPDARSGGKSNFS